MHSVLKVAAPKWLIARDADPGKFFAVGVFRRAHCTIHVNFARTLLALPICSMDSPENRERRLAHWNRLRALRGFSSDELRRIARNEAAKCEGAARSRLRP